MKKISIILKKLLLTSIIVGLTVSNVLVLLNAEVHALAFNGLKTVVSSIFVKEAIPTILNNSPTERYNAVEVKYNKAIQAQIKLSLEFKQKLIITQRISKRIAYRTERHAIKSISSFIPRITPVIGAAATATFTVIEINDDCQTLKDLNELSTAIEGNVFDDAKVCGIDISFLKGYLHN